MRRITVAIVLLAASGCASSIKKPDTMPPVRNVAPRVSDRMRYNRQQEQNRPLMTKVDGSVLR